MGNNCSCIKGKFDFYINEVNCDKILYQDLSLWMSGDNYKVPNFYEVEIYDLDKDGCATTLIKKIEVCTIGVTDISKLVQLSDGVYELRVKSCQNTYKRWTAIVAKLQCCLDKYLASDEYDVDKYQEADRLLNGARTTASFDQPKESLAFYKKAKKLIDKLNCDC